MKTTFSFVVFVIVVGKARRNGSCNGHFFLELVLHDSIRFLHVPLTGTCPMTDKNMKKSNMQQNGANFTHDHEATLRQQKIFGLSSVSQQKQKLFRTNNCILKY